MYSSLIQISTISGSNVTGNGKEKPQKKNSTRILENVIAYFNSNNIFQYLGIS